MLSDMTGASLGKHAKIFSLAKIIHSGSNLRIGDYSQIDDFVLINAGTGCNIGRFVHIASFSTVIGGGEFIMGDFSGLSAGVRIITGTDDFSGGYLSNPTVPHKYKNVETSFVSICRHVIVGSNAVILPGITIGEGATVGAGAIVTKDLEPWGIYAGFAARKIGERDAGAVLNRERELLAEIDDIE
jgi:acetyltransferase-like isoleucine patch superfamily enzyme